MDTIRLFLLILKRTHGDVILKGFLVWFFISSLLLWWLDPSLTNWGDGLWLAFNIASSIGLGDYTVTTFGARTVAVLLGLYGVVVVAFIPGMVASYYVQKVSFKVDSSIENNFEQLDHLDSLTKHQLKDLSMKIQAGNRQLNEKELLAKEKQK